MVSVNGRRILGTALGHRCAGLGAVGEELEAASMCMMSMLGENRGIQRTMYKAAAFSQRHRRQHYQGAHESARFRGSDKERRASYIIDLEDGTAAVAKFCEPTKKVRRAAVRDSRTQRLLQFHRKSSLGVARRSFQEHTDSFELSRQIHLGSGDHEALSAVLRSKKREEMSENGFVEVTSSFSS